MPGKLIDMAKLAETRRLEKEWRDTGTVRMTLAATAREDHRDTDSLLHDAVGSALLACADALAAVLRDT